MVRALSDTDLIRKLLAMKIEATTAEMLAVCRTHIAIAENLQQRTLPATLARRLVTGSRSAGSLTRPRMPTRNPSHNLNGDMEEGKGQMR